METMLVVYQNDLYKVLKKLTSDKYILENFKGKTIFAPINECENYPNYYDIDLHGINFVLKKLGKQVAPVFHNIELLEEVALLLKYNDFLLERG